MKMKPGFVAVAMVLLAVLQGCAHNGSAGSVAAQTAPSLEVVQHTLAPQGSLRVAMYRGSPTSFVQTRSKSKAKAAPRGVGHDLGQAFAKSLGVRFEAKVFPNNAEALRAVAAGEADFTFTNATAERAKAMDFSPTVLDVEKSVLVARKSAIRVLDDLKKPGLRIGVSAGSSTGSELAPIYPDATLVPVATLGKALGMLRSGKIDGFATNKAILFEMSDKLPGSRVVPGRWGMEHFAIGVPRGREAGSQWIADFVRDAVAQGEVNAAVERARLRGVAPAQ